MLLKEFLSLVTPGAGYRYVTAIQQKVDGQKQGAVLNVPYSTVQAGVSGIEDVDQADGYNVYFSCASFAKPEYVDGKGKRKTRTAENAIAARAIWRDLDVGADKPNAYASQQDAVMAIIALCGELDLPAPIVVSSGNGIHAYWPFNRDVPKEEWLRLAEMAKQVFPKFGLKSDPARDCDIASVLRPPGSHNKGKTRGSPQLPVEIISSETVALDPDEFVTLLSPYVVTDALTDVPAYMRNRLGLMEGTEALARHREFPPSFAEIVASRCAQIASFKDTGGTSYAAWWLGVGLCKHTVEGAAKAHEWSSKHNEYNEAETQKKFDSWEKGPPTCEAYADEGGRCKGCVHMGKIKSPIQLGYEENPPQQEVAVDAPTDEEILDKVVLPERFAFRNGIVSHLTMIDGKPEYLPVTRTLFWLDGRYWVPPGEMIYSGTARVRQLKDGKWQYRRFEIPASMVGSGGRDLHERLGSIEVFATGSGKGAKTRMDSLVAAMAEQLRQRVEEKRAYRVFGWQEDGCFLIGDQRLTADKVSTVKLSGDSAPTFLPAFAKNGGSAQEWSRIVAKMYAHPGHAPFQLVVLFAIGSPLLKFYNLPTGCLVNLVGEKGTGKTTAARVGLSAYGDPVTLSAEFRSSTELALYNRLATLHSLPTSVDELTNIEPMKASNIIYSIMSGQPRDAMRVDGKRREQLLSWALVTFGTANESVIELLTTVKADASAEISRLIELDWPKVKTIERREMDALLDELPAHYGAMGNAFVTWVIENEKKARNILFKAREFIEDELRIDKESRFWSAHIAVPLATKLILQEMGLLNEFEFDPLLQCALATVREHKELILTSTMDPLTAFHAMVTSISDKIISTNTLKDGRMSTPDGVLMNGEPLGRAIIETDDLYLAVTAIRDWCAERRIPYKAMRKTMLEAGYLKSEEKFYLGRGTTRVTGQTYTWHMKLSKVLGYHAGAAEDGHLRLVKPVV